MKLNMRWFKDDLIEYECSLCNKKIRIAKESLIRMIVNTCKFSNYEKFIFMIAKGLWIYGWISWFVCSKQ